MILYSVENKSLRQTSAAHEHVRANKSELAPSGIYMLINADGKKRKKKKKKKKERKGKNKIK